MITSRSSFGSRGRRRTLSSSSRRASSALEPVDLLARHRPELVVAHRPSRAARGRRPARRGSPRAAGYASTTGSRRDSSWPSRRMAAGSVEVSGRASSAWISSYCRATSASLVVEVAHDPGGGSVGAASRWASRRDGRDRALRWRASPPGSLGRGASVAARTRRSRPGRTRRRRRAPAPSTRSRPRSCRRSAAWS